MATVSIIIPAYNYAHYLAEAIDSALAQTYPDIEVIVVDDGSTDDTAEVCKTFGDQIRYHYKKNAGLSAARNTGIELAKGKYALFLDADDILLPSMVERCMEVFDSDSSDIGVAACTRVLIDENGKVVEERPREKAVAEMITARDLLLMNRITVACALVRVAVFDSVGRFDEALTSSEDRDMWIRIASTFKLTRIPDELVRYRVHSSNMSRNTDRMSQNMARVLEKARRAGVESSASSLFWHSVFAFKDYQVSWMAHAEGRSLTAIGLILRSILRYPIYWEPAKLDSPLFFRVRSLRRFIFGLMKRDAI
jgi:glycosyltransferase involved in cell wall biosynthesis